MSTPAPNVKPRARRAKAKAARPKKASAPSKAVRFQSRGPYKCVKIENVSCQGVHPVLQRVVHPFCYDAAVASNTLITFDNPPAQTFVAAQPTRNTRRLAYGQKQGVVFDSQLTSVIKIRHKHKIPLKAFYDAALREHFLVLKFGRKVSREGSAIRRLCQRLLPETEHALRYWQQYGYNPVETQVAVADKEVRVGTRVDVVCKKEDKHCIFEMKLGCERNFSDGQRMNAPFQNRVFTTHGEHQLQTVLTHWLYKRTFPEAQMGAPVLLRCDRLGAHGYAPARWAVEGLPALLPRLRA